MVCLTGWLTQKSVQVLKWNENVILKEKKNDKTTKKRTLKCEESVSFRFVTVNCVKENLNNNNKNFSDFVYIFYYIFAGIIP